MLGRQWGSPGRTSFGHCGFFLRKVYLAGWQFLYRLSAGSALTPRAERLLETQGAEDPGGPGMAWRGPGAAGSAGTRGDGAGRPLAPEAPPAPPRTCPRSAPPGARPSVPCAWLPWTPLRSRLSPRPRPGKSRAPASGLLARRAMPQAGDPERAPGTQSQPPGHSGRPQAGGAATPLSGRQNRWLGLTPPFPLPSTRLERMPRKSSHHQTTTTFSHYY